MMGFGDMPIKINFSAFKMVKKTGKVKCPDCPVVVDSRNLSRHRKNNCAASDSRRLKEELQRTKRTCQFCGDAFKQKSHCKRHEDQRCAKNSNRGEKKDVMPGRKEEVQHRDGNEKSGENEDADAGRIKEVEPGRISEAQPGRISEAQPGRI